MPTHAHTLSPCLSLNFTYIHATHTLSLPVFLFLSYQRVTPPATHTCNTVRMICLGVAVKGLCKNASINTNERMHTNARMYTSCMYEGYLRDPVEVEDHGVGDAQEGHRGRGRQEAGEGKAPCEEEEGLW